MEDRFCEVVGCCRPATWVRAADSSSNLEEALCSHCWAVLRFMKPQTAMLYTQCEEAIGFSERLSVSRFPETDYEATIYIG